MHPRCPNPPKLICSPRSSIELNQHSNIDSVLKELKASSRRLRTIISSFGDDLKILERLYYKSKNQHRMALFFKRTTEIRRYGQRLVEMKIVDTVDTLRTSFFGASNQKSTRVAWNHVPNSLYVIFVAERLTACSTLITKVPGKLYVFNEGILIVGQTDERLLKAHRHFALAMQSGAFIQLILLFSGIASRMLSLVQELQESLKTSISICQRILCILNPSYTLKSPQHVGQISRPVEPFVLQGDASTAELDSYNEDLGTSIRRSSSTQSHKLPPRRVDTDHHDTETRESSIIPVPELIISGVSAFFHTSDSLIPSRSVPTTDAPVPNTIPQVKETKRRTQSGERLKKAKTRKNEIDDIFGL
ncbi:hypothetical protein BJ138DRAFT_1076218 [Hygrophoropsis aurantiaca]|uniref:Uncharacterized protein n=1 Tax=Hygrophoropsis aurantiaca TaxID=72124 RepID=A0ACB8ARS4_9AGAM|nr:hypothetical protein BJ138DRAFT_1076218 [Hygrophoropsis aurantiaca]